MFALCVFSYESYCWSNLERDVIPRTLITSKTINNGQKTIKQTTAYGIERISFQQQNVEWMCCYRSVCCCWFFFEEKAVHCNRYKWEIHYFWFTLAPQKRHRHTHVRRQKQKNVFLQARKHSRSDCVCV